MREGTKWGMWDRGIFYNGSHMINLMYVIGICILFTYSFATCFMFT